MPGSLEVFTSPAMSTIRYPADLPITARREEILAALRASQVVILAGETGSGKTTQLPKMCLEAGLAERGRIGCTQPRRVAAMSVSKRVAEELGVVWGRDVGCKIRFGDDTSRDTRIKFMTDGILLAEIQSDPMLRAYSALILDEAHERSLNIDFLLGYLQSLLKKRPELKLLITSATIDTEAFSKAFGGAPIISVSGRLYPVEIIYAPIDGRTAGEQTAAPKTDQRPAPNRPAPASVDDAADGNYVEAAVRAVEQALLETDTGDVLVFMPTERDIRDTRDLLETNLGRGTEVISLFGRMPAGEQARIFSPGVARRVIVATNIAETSLTLPRIRTVIDTGLARMSRYNPRTRTKRLPVEAISQSSANQRAGRAGRLSDGTCIRLYAQDDFEGRPAFTQPEIQRADLAEVILRMKAFRLGEIETFPFLDPPRPEAIRAGYQLLHELGALDDTNELTPLGRELARLPLDPAPGRMLLQAREENVLEEMLVIAAGLSVPDPRERPEDDREAAAAAHKNFADEQSDFMSMLKLWNAAPPLDAKASRNALRRFCKTNYLSLTRMREWRDIHGQLRDAMESATRRSAQSQRHQRQEKEQPKSAPEEPRRGREPKADARVSTDEIRFAAIHRSILSGLLGHIAMRKESNSYQASGNRLVTLFPGSHLYARRERVRRAPVATGPAGAAPEKSKQPAWIVAGEIVQTSQLFARMAARIEPPWVIEVGAHLCRFSYLEPHWSAKAGRVLVWERVLLHGMELRKQHIDHGRVNMAEATELFIRGALIAEETHAPHRFIAHNRQVRAKVETVLTRVRSRRMHDIDEALYHFYAARIEGVSSVHDLNRFVRDRIARDPDFLCATEADLLGAEDAAYDRAQFPEEISIGNAVLPVRYSYAPGGEEDGVTVRVPLPVAERLTSAQLQWAVPALREEQIGILLRALPKALRVALMPIDPKIAVIAREFSPGEGEFLPTLATFLSRKYGVTVRAEDWPPQSLPAHLRLRVEVIDGKQKTVASGRDLSDLQTLVGKMDLRSDHWDRAVQKWERYAVSGWTFGDLPASVVVEQIAGSPVLGYPGLALRDGDVDLLLFRKPEEPFHSSPAAVRRLAERELGRDLAWLEKELQRWSRATPAAPKKPADFKDALSQLGAKLEKPGAVTVAAGVPPETLEKSAREHVLATALAWAPALPLTEIRFKNLVATARRELPEIVARVRQHTAEILAQRQRLLVRPTRYAALESDLQRLLPPDFLARTPHAQLPHLTRYLKAMEMRADRALISPAKDAEKVRQIAAFDGWEKRVPVVQREAFRWLLEEFRVSIFAQELGTAQPVSAQRLKVLGML